MSDSRNEREILVVEPSVAKLNECLSDVCKSWREKGFHVEADKMQQSSYTGEYYARIKIRAKASHSRTRRAR